MMGPLQASKSVMLIRIKLDPDERDGRGGLPLAPEIRATLGVVQASAGLADCGALASVYAAFRALRKANSHETNVFTRCVLEQD